MPQIIHLTFSVGVPNLRQPVYGRRRMRASTILGGWARFFCFKGVQPFLGSLCFASLHEWFQSMPTRCSVAASECKKAVHLFANIARVSLGFVFLVSGVSKLWGPTAAESYLAQIVPFAKPAAAVLVAIVSVVECVMGAMLCSNLMVPLVATIAGAFLLGGTLMGVIMLTHPVPCCCFGGLFESRTDESFLVRNFVLLGLVIAVLHEHTTDRARA
jgi:hypothetical protein